MSLVNIDSIQCIEISPYFCEIIIRNNTVGYEWILSHEEH